MIAKMFEVRDAGTFIPMLAVKLTPACEADRYLLARAGYGTTHESQSEYVQLCSVAGGEGFSTCSPYDWGGSRTLQTAHQFIIENFDRLESGAVICVEHILGERATPNVSERLGA